MVPCGGTSQDPLMSLTARSAVLCIRCPPPQRITAAHCTGVYVNSRLGVLTHSYCTAVHSASCIHQYFENNIVWVKHHAIQQFNTVEEIHRGELCTVCYEFSIQKCSWSCAKKPACCEYTICFDNPKMQMFSTKDSYRDTLARTHKHAVCQLHAAGMLSFF